MTATDPSNIRPAGLNQPVRPGGHKPLSILIVLGVVIGLCDVVNDSVFIAQAYWLGFVDQGGGASQSQLLIPYIVVAIRAMFYLAIVSEAWRLNRAVKRGITAMSEAVDRGAVAMLICIAGCFVNAAGTLFVVWDAAAHVVGMRGESFAPVVAQLVSTDLTAMGWMAVASLVADAILVVAAAATFSIVRSARFRTTMGVEARPESG
ncbi:MAG TPA: hypothetical protein H9902_09885 [Candidatus Stackebrandtia faecavium]|nr:hypothetical protein [Candidatus Stackebrandtia faecavium]